MYKFFFVLKKEPSDLYHRVFFLSLQKFRFFGFILK